MGEIAVPLPIDSPVLALMVLLLCLGVVAFFSSSEAALISVNRVRIRHMAEKGSGRARTVQRILQRHDKLFATILLSENVFIIFASAFAGVLAVRVLGTAGVTVATVVMTILVVALGEIAPKTFAAQNAEQHALRVAPLVSAIIRGLGPVVWAFSAVTNGLIRVLGDSSRVRSPFVTEEEILMAIRIGEEEKVIGEEEREMLFRVFKFGDRLAHEVMVPRTDMVAVPRGTTVREFLRVFSRHRHARYPVYEGTTDNVVGVITIKDVTLALAQERATVADSIDALMREAYLVPESKRVGVLFAEMQEDNVHMAVVLDEFGGTAGLVTMENLLEEIVGDMRDELVEAPPTTQVVDERTHIVEADVRVEDANEELDLGLPSGDYETLAGFVLSSLGHIPQEGEVVRHGDVELAVSKMHGVRIEKLLVRKL